MSGAAQDWVTPAPLAAGAASVGILYPLPGLFRYECCLALRHLATTAAFYDQPSVGVLPPMP